VLRQSGLLTRERADDLQRRLEQGLLKPESLARHLGEAGVLSASQVEEIVRGQWQDILFGPYLLLEPRLGSGGLPKLTSAATSTWGGKSP
jgi:hypothetical protein